MAISIGGSPGTGSSLLRQMLNRHSQIYCGPETNVFAFPGLFSRWPSLKNRLTVRRQRLAGKLVAPSVRTIHGTRLVGAEQTWTYPDLREVIAASPTFAAFCEGYFAKPCAVYGKRMWAEKTPANVLTFDHFLESWEQGIAVHMTRHPLDTIVSLVDRGITLYEATARYLYNTAWAMRHAGHARMTTVKYEALVSDPLSALEQLLSMVEIEFEPTMTSDGNPAMTEPDRIEGWRYRETGAPQQGSVGRFNQAETQLQHAVSIAARAIRINPEFARAHDLLHGTVAEMAQALRYDLPQIGGHGDTRAVIEQLRRQERTYRRKRILKNNWWFERNRPVSIIEL